MGLASVMDGCRGRECRAGLTALPRDPTEPRQASTKRMAWRRSSIMHSRSVRSLWRFATGIRSLRLMCRGSSGFQVTSQMRAVVDDLRANAAEKFVCLVDAAHAPHDHVEIAGAQQAAGDARLGGALELCADAAGHAHAHARLKAEIVNRYSGKLLQRRSLDGQIKGGPARGPSSYAYDFSHESRSHSHSDRHTVRRDGRVDEDAFVRILHHLAENGSHGAVVAGTTGEAPTLARRRAPRA